MLHKAMGKAVGSALTAPLREAKWAIKDQRRKNIELREVNRESTDPLYRAQKEAERESERLAKEYVYSKRQAEAPGQHAFATIIVILGVFSVIFTPVFCVGAFCFIGSVFSGELDNILQSSLVVVPWIMVTTLWQFLRKRYRKRYEVM